MRIPFVLALTGVGCGPPVAAVGLYGEIDQAVWDAIGDAPAALLARIDRSDPRMAANLQGRPEVELIGTLSPGEERFDEALGLWAGCPLPTTVDVWLVPEDLVPVLDPPFVDPGFTSEGWPRDTVFAFPFADGEPNANPLKRLCKNAYMRVQVGLQ